MRDVDGGRAQDGADVVGSTDTEHAIATVAASDTVALSRRLDTEAAQDARAVQGPGATLRALQQGQVDVLLVHDDLDDDRSGWFGPHPLEAASTRAELDAIGAPEAIEGRLVDVAIRAALGSGAGVRVVPAHAGHLVDGFAALLRWPR